MTAQTQLDEAQRAAMALSIQDRISCMWREAEKSSGGRPNQFYREDGEFIIEGMVHARGRDEIAKTGSHRQQIAAAPRHSRHLMTNFSFDFGRYEREGIVDVFAVMHHFGGNGEPPIMMEPPIGIYDVNIAMARQPDETWLIVRWRMNPIFIDRNHPALNMPKAFSHPGAA